MNNGFETGEIEDDGLADLLAMDYISTDEQEEECPFCQNGCKYCLMLER